VRKITYWLALILIFIVPWEDSISVSTLGSIARLMGLILAAFWMATMLLEGRFRKPHLFHILVFLFFLWNFISFFWSLNSENTIQRMKTLSQIYLLMLIYWEVLQEPEQLMAGLQAYIYGSYVLIGSTISNYVSGNVAVAYEGRYSATGVNANDLTLILMIGLPLAMQLFFAAGRSKWGTVLKIINLAFVPLAIFAIVLTGSRTSLIAIVPFGIYLVVTQQIKFSQKLSLFAILMMSLLAILPFIPDSVISRLGTIGSSIGEGDLGGRGELWLETIAVLAQYPVLGVGSGAIMSSIGSAVHNTVLSVAADTGLVGLVLFLLILGIVFYQAIRLPKGAAGLWLTIFLTWLIGILSLSWDVKKLTWIILNFIIIEGSLRAQLLSRASDRSAPESIQPTFGSHSTVSRHRAIS
jgi:O-antigen ligase